MLTSCFFESSVKIILKNTKSVIVQTEESRSYNSFVIVLLLVPFGNANLHKTSENMLPELAMSNQTTNKSTSILNCT